MAWAGVLLSVLSGIRDANLRSSVITAVYSILEDFAHGWVSEEEAIAAITDIIVDLMMAKDPTITRDEAIEKASRLAEQIVREYKLQKMASLSLTRFGTPGRRRLRRPA